MIPANTPTVGVLTTRSFKKDSVHISYCCFRIIKSKYEYVLTTPSMAMYSSLRGLTILKSRSIHSKIAIIITSSFFGAGLQNIQVVHLHLTQQQCPVCLFGFYACSHPCGVPIKITVCS
jgi:hypothetical protein